jgi:hypothetical protein
VEAWLLARILFRFVAVAILAWQGVAAASRGGAWWAFAIPSLAFALFFAVMTVAILWAWASELGGVRGHS